MCLYSLHLSQAVSSSHFTVPFCEKQRQMFIQELLETGISVTGTTQV